MIGFPIILIFYIGEKIINYSDYLVWHNKKDIQKQEEYWKNKFMSGIPLLDFKKCKFSFAKISKNFDYYIYRRT